MKQADTIVSSCSLSKIKIWMENTSILFLEHYLYEFLKKLKLNIIMYLNAIRF